MTAPMLPGSREYRLLGILQEHAPTGTEQQFCVEMVQHMQRDHCTSEQVEMYLAEAIVSGLRYDNWPWNRNTGVTNGG